MAYRYTQISTAENQSHVHKRSCQTNTHTHIHTYCNTHLCAGHIRAHQKMQRIHQTLTMAVPYNWHTRKPMYTRHVHFTSVFQPCCKSQRQPFRRLVRISRHIISGRHQSNLPRKSRYAPSYGAGTWPWGILWRDCCSVTFICKIHVRADCVFFALRACSDAACTKFLLCHGQPG
jgi:hypothetical protein